MSNNNDWMPQELRDEWDRAKADAEAHREQVERTLDPGAWTDAQHDTFADIVDEAKRKSKTGEKMTREEREALKLVLKDPEKFVRDAHISVANKREAATPNVRYNPEDGEYYDRYGRPCNADGRR